MSEQQLEFWENAAIAASASILQLSPEIVTRLLRTHWNWIYPTFAFIPKHTFLRDAATGGPFFSELLLCVICLHSTRFTDYALGEELLPRVRLMLGRALHGEPKITTVQALLQLSAYEIGKGAPSQAWLYSGMAFRMAVDLGIFASCKNLTLADAIGQKVSQQLAWSCYLWDKAISLYLGRVAVIQEQPSFPPQVIDDCAEYDRWSNFYGDDDLKSITVANFSLPSYTNCCLANFCKLASIINDILSTVYSKKHWADVFPLVQQLRQRLDVWRSQSPRHLVIDSGRWDGRPVPSHIVTQNMLYWTTMILLYRPFRANATCRSVCHDAAGSVEELLLLMDKSYGLSRVVYIQAYCAYTAATVAMLDLRDGIPGQEQRVSTYLRTLYAVRIPCPSIQRSIDIIIRNLDTSKSSEASSSSQTGTPQIAGRTEGDNPPVFFFDQPLALAADECPNMEDLAFGELDSFPFEYMGMPHDAIGQYM